MHDVEELQDRVEELSTEVASLESAVEDLTTQVEDFRRELNQLKGEVIPVPPGTKIELIESKASYDTYNETVTACKQELDKALTHNHKNKE